MSAFPTSGSYSIRRLFLGSYIEDGWSRDSAVGIATDYGLDDRAIGVRVPVGSRTFAFSMSSRPALRPTQPPIQWVPGLFLPSGKVAGA
jgi:hypothetical protein